MMIDNTADIPFEKAIERLEEIVHTLEEGSLSLEDSLNIFEEGVRLSQICMKRLDEAEKKIEILVKEKGRTGTKLFSPETDINGNDKRSK